MSTSLESLAGKVMDGQRLSAEEALCLHQEADIATLGLLADEIRRRKHPQPVVTYIIDRNLNPTNVCITDCGFCAFYARPKDEAKAYVLDREEIYRKIQETVDVGGVQILMQGGHHPYLKVDWFESLLSDIKQRWPKLHLHAMSPPEIHHLARISKISTREVIRRLKAAGMDSIPGGGAEILVESVREKIAPKKATTDDWLRVMEEAHEEGLKTTATMMFGHVETVADRIEHLNRLRQVQDRTGGFTAFIDWTFQPGGNPMGEALLQQGWRKATYVEYFRTTAVARIFLDNFDNLQASFVTQGGEAAALALRMGCNDFGSAMLEENVVSAAGCFELVGLKDIEDRIRGAGFVPRQRNQAYQIIDSRGPEPLPGELQGCGAAATGRHDKDKAFAR
ncbi:MAG: dehypoxanthine futalosine cyclase [Planctomycetota bacterium]|nr:MAG: dehypoxanthine futalosine cyclase [Planctomycetota bacterium]